MRGPRQRTSTIIGQPKHQMSHAWVKGSRLLLLVTALLVLVMPLTEYFWHFDKFLHGGQDFELSLLAVATSLCLALVLLQQRKKGIAIILAVRQWLSFLFQHGDLTKARTPARATSLIPVPTPPLALSALSLYNQPLQI
ncbi:hypothetical protein [Granulicella tundricola]|uniref:Uncharacterized protein n=1 Tax=Granulicella tundricola (strain ATCC BAA-1859 / DSM 23138 / MP5ACTX9) TaxID=1198114 RepID=E8X4F4_GRATM|nr:hypothetical protein [Granulicella tundricola]ADW68281.1 hypothetical protein AciX9_1218 [Granulicella tundricola MP5ACTX9]